MIQAIELLKASELYVPSLRADDSLSISDPTTADLIGALISVSDA